MMLILIFLIVAVVAVLFAREVCYKRARMHSAQTEANIKWVMDFNVSLGLKLGGVLGVAETFADPQGILREIIKLNNEMDSLCDSGKTRDEAAAIIVERIPVGSILDKSASKRITVIAEYVGFYSQALRRLKKDARFGSWVEQSEFSVYPDMMTAAVLKVAHDEVSL